MMTVQRRSGPEEFISVASGRLKWARDGDDLASGRYRIRLLGPGQWETTRGGRVLRVDTRRSIALAAAEHHHRETQRIQQITRWGLSAGAALVAAMVARLWILTPLGLFLFAGAVWLFVASLARLSAAITKNLLDPYRARESWEPPDWWNRND
jgi:hypothetical protein